MHVQSGSAAGLPDGLYAKLASYRYKVFIERLGWRVKSCGEHEADQFDRPDTVYVVAQDPLGRISGCARLLPTHRPYLLGEVFPQLLNGLEPPRSPDVWELSRFAAVDLHSPVAAQGQISSPVAIGLLREAVATAIAHGAKQLVSVSPIGVERLLRAAGFRAWRAGPPMVIDGHPIFACWIDLQSSDVL